MKTKKEESNILFTEDILQQAADELGISYKKVEIVYNVLIKHIRHLVSFTNTVSIFIPHIGTMYTKVGTIYGQIKKHKIIQKKNPDSPDSKKRLIAWEKKKKLMDKYLSKNRMSLTKCYHLKPTKFNMSRFNGGKTLDEIEAFQNKRNS